MEINTPKIGATITTVEIKIIQGYGRYISIFLKKQPHVHQSLPSYKKYLADAAHMELVDY